MAPLQEQLLATLWHVEPAWRRPHPSLCFPHAQTAFSCSTVKKQPAQPSMQASLKPQQGLPAHPWDCRPTGRIELPRGHRRGHHLHKATLKAKKAIAQLSIATTSPSACVSRVGRKALAPHVGPTSYCKTSTLRDKRVCQASCVIPHGKLGLPVELGCGAGTGRRALNRHSDVLEAERYTWHGVHTSGRLGNSA